MKIASV